jgi:hypothetical protein
MRKSHDTLNAAPFRGCGTEGITVIPQTQKRKDITMKTTLQKKLAKIAPSICIKTTWSPDPNRGEYDGHDDIRPDGWDAWNADITATVILCGEEWTVSIVDRVLRNQIHSAIEFIQKR